MLGSKIPSQAPIHRSRILTGLVAGVFGLLLTASGCFSDGDRIKGSGNVETRSFDLADFDRIDISAAFEAEVAVVPGSAHEVKVSADDNLFDELRIEVDGRTLEIGTRPNVRLDSTQMSAQVTLPGLFEVKASGASDVTVDPAGDELDDLEASGASSLHIFEVNSSELSIDVSGASRVEIDGSRTATAQIDASGASRVDLDGLPIDSASVDVSGASEVRFGPAAEVSGSASGASTVRVEEATHVDIKTSGASSVDRS